MMNILHVSANFPPLLGGPAASVPYIAAEQAKAGCSVFVLTAGSPEVSVQSSGGAAYTIYRCGNVSGPQSSLKSGLVKAVKMGLMGRRIIRKHRINIIHAHDPNISAIACIIMDPFHRIPSLVKYSGDLAWELVGLKKGKHEDRFWDSPAAKFLVLVERYLFSNFSRIAVQNRYQEDMLKRICRTDEKKIVLIPNGISVYNYTKEERDRASGRLPAGFKVVSSSRLVSWKGVEYGIMAMKHIRGSYVVIGDGPEMGRLNRLAKSNGVGDRVIFPGALAHKDVQLYLSLCDVFLTPSLYEPFGINILDAFAAGIPAVGSNTGGIPELLDKEQMFETGDIADIVKKIEYASMNGGEIVKRQRQKLQPYLWPEVVQDMLAGYGKLLC